MNKTADSKTIFKFLDACLMVRRVQPNRLILSAHEKALTKGTLAWYNITRVELKNFRFSAGLISLSTGNTVLRPLRKRLLFAMIKNADFNGAVDTNP